MNKNDATLLKRGSIYYYKRTLAAVQTSAPWWETWVFGTSRTLKFYWSLTLGCASWSSNGTWATWCARGIPWLTFRGSRRAVLMMESSYTLQAIGLLGPGRWGSAFLTWRQTFLRPPTLPRNKAQPPTGASTRPLLRTFSRST